MAASIYPVALPPPISIQISDAESRDLAESGMLGAQLRSTDRVTDLEVTFELSNREAGLFANWIEIDLLGGGCWFTASWDIFRAARFQLASEPEWEHLPASRRQIKLKLKAYGESSAPDFTPAPGFTLSPPQGSYSGTEGVGQFAENNGTVEWVLRFSSPTLDTVTMQLTVSGTAVNPDDYSSIYVYGSSTLSAGVLTIPPGMQSISIYVTPTNDSDIEDDKTISLSLEVLSGTTTNLTASAHSVIVSEDRPAVSINTIFAARTSGEAVFTLTRLGGTSRHASVAYYTSDDTAVAPTDYISASGDVIFLPGESTKDLRIALVTTSTTSTGKLFHVNIYGGWGISVPGGSATGVCEIT